MQAGQALLNALHFCSCLDRAPIIAPEKLKNLSTGNGFELKWFG